MTTSYEASSVSASTCMKSAWTITLLYHHFPSCMMVCTEVKSEPPETSVDYKEGLQLGCTFSCEKLVGEFSCSPRKWEENKKRRKERRNEIKGHLIWAFEQSGEQVNEHKQRTKKMSKKQRRSRKQKRSRRKIAGSDELLNSAVLAAIPDVSQLPNEAESWWATLGWCWKMKTCWRKKLILKLNCKWISWRFKPGEVYKANTWEGSDWEGLQPKHLGRLKLVRFAT